MRDGRAPGRAFGETAGLASYEYVATSVLWAIRLREGQELTCHEISPAAAVGEALGIGLNAHLRGFQADFATEMAASACRFVDAAGVFLGGRVLKVILASCTFFARLEQGTLSSFCLRFELV